MFISVPYFTFCSHNLCLWSISSVCVGLARNFVPYVFEATSHPPFSGRSFSADPFDADAYRLIDPSTGDETYPSICVSGAAVPRHVYASDAFSPYYCPDSDSAFASL